jgi:hypothetical protein
MKELQVFDELKAEITLFVEPVLKVQVTDKTTQDKALITAKKIKEFEKAVEERRTELVGPLNEQVKKINAFAKQIIAPLKNGELHLKDQLIAWEKKLEVERIEAQKRLDAEKRKREAELRAEEQRQAEEQKALESVFGEIDQFEVEQKRAEEDRKRFLAQDELDKKEKQIANDRVKGTQKVWDFKIIDPLLVPREFLIVDEKMVRAAVKAGVRQIAGIEIFEDTRISIR